VHEGVYAFQNPFCHFFRGDSEIDPYDFEIKIDGIVSRYVGCAVQEMNDLMHFAFLVWRLPDLKRVSVFAIVHANACDFRGGSIFKEAQSFNIDGQHHHIL